MSETLQGRLYRRLDEAPARPALAFVDRAGRFEWLSFENVHARAAEYGAGFIELGCGPGERCVIVLPSGEECADVLLGALLAGAVPLLVAPPVLQPSAHSAFRANLEHTLDVVRPRVVVAADGLGSSPMSPPEGCRVVAPESLTRPGRRLERPGRAPEDTAALQLTSGTTGVPRVCRWTHAAVLASLDGMERAMGLSPTDVCFNWTPLYHDMGLVNNFFLCLTAGIPLALLSPTDFVVRPSRWLRGLAATGATISWSPNFGFALATERIEADEMDGVRLDRVRGLWNAAERIHPETMLAFHERFAPYGLGFEALKTNFGCAENVGGATFSDPDGPFRWEEVDLDALFDQGRALLATEGSGTRTRVASAGGPVEGMRIVIAGPDGRPLPDGEVGHVLLDTPSRMAEYLGDPEATREAFAHGLLETGDIGYLRDGELYWVGRSRERITVRGKKIDPSEFERMLAGVAGVRAGCFVAFGVADPRLGTERPVVVCEVTGDGRALAEIAGDVHQAASAELGLTLDEVVLVEKGTLAKTSSGKRRHSHFRGVYENDGLEALHRTKGADG